MFFLSKKQQCWHALLAAAFSRACRRSRSPASSTTKVLKAYTAIDHFFWYSKFIFICSLAARDSNTPTAPQRDIDFVLNEVFDYPKHCQSLGFKDVDKDLVRRLISPSCAFTAYLGCVILEQHTQLTSSLPHAGVGGDFRVRQSNMNVPSLHYL